MQPQQGSSGRLCCSQEGHVGHPCRGILILQRGCHSRGDTSTRSRQPAWPARMQDWLWAGRSGSYSQRAPGPHGAFLVLLQDGSRKDSSLLSLSVWAGHRFNDSQPVTCHAICLLPGRQCGKPLCVCVPAQGLDCSPSLQLPNDCQVQTVQSTGFKVFNCNSMTRTCPTPCAGLAATRGNRCH